MSDTQPPSEAQAPSKAAKINMGSTPIRTKLVLAALLALTLVWLYVLFVGVRYLIGLLF